MITDCQDRGRGCDDFYQLLKDSLAHRMLSEDMLQQNFEALQ